MTDEALPTFRAEARELSAEIESALLACESGERGPETINTLFRAVHTIKGSAGLFGLETVVDFAHVVETILDRVRSGAVSMSDELVALLIECHDHIGYLIAASDPADPAIARAGTQLCEQLQRVGGSVKQRSGATPTIAAEPREECWHISLQFARGILKDGMDPLSCLQYLGTFGVIESIAVIGDALPAAADFDAELCYLGFELRFRTAEGRARIEGAFEFVRQDCRLAIHALDSQQNSIEAQRPAENAQSRSTRDEEHQSVRVDAGKLDNLIDLLGELVTATAATRLQARPARLAGLNEAVLRMSRLVEEAREQTLKLRMIQIGSTFARFQRLVRDVARQLGKHIVLETSGADTELDKTLIEKIVDPLTHLVRNAIDHGIEPAAVREAAGKRAAGTVRLNALHDSGSVVIEVSDDGGGLNRERILRRAQERGLVTPGESLSDRQVHALIFEPGFSTAEAVTNLSGRGVGMDVVRRNVMQLRGSVEIDSREGAGTTVRIRLPLTLAIIDGFLVRSAQSSFVIPLEQIEECVELTESERTGSDHRFIHLRGAVLPFVRLREVFSLHGAEPRRESIVVVRSAGRRIGIVVDDLLGELQTVIKPLSRLFSRIRSISGSTILGDGRTALILDVSGVVEDRHELAAVEDTSHQGTPASSAAARSRV